MDLKMVFSSNKFEKLLFSIFQKKGKTPHKQRSKIYLNLQKNIYQKHFQFRMKFVNGPTEIEDNHF